MCTTLSHSRWLLRLLSFILEIIIIFKVLFKWIKHNKTESSSYFKCISSRILDEGAVKYRALYAWGCMANRCCFKPDSIRSYTQHLQLLIGKLTPYAHTKYARTYDTFFTNTMSLRGSAALLFFQQQFTSNMLAPCLWSLRRTCNTIFARYCDHILLGFFFFAFPLFFRRSDFAALKDFPLKLTNQFKLRQFSAWISFI